MTRPPLSRALDQVSHLTIGNAPLPANYESAKRALADCVSVDECLTWADKAAAIRSYARQADDDALHKLAIRVQARAVRRCGELLREFDAQGARTDKLGAGACTLAVDSMGVVSVKVPDGAGALADPVAGAISAGGIYIASYDTTAGVWVLINPSVLGALSNYLPLAGGALTGALTERSGSITAVGGVAGASDMATAATFRGEIEVRGDGAGAAMMTFHRPDAFAGYFGIDTDNVWKVGGWSHGANAYQIWHAGANVDGRDIAADGAKLDGIEAGATRNAAWYGMMLGIVTNGDYRIILNARRAGTIGQTTTRCASGTATATFKINGAALGGAANSVSSSEQTQAHASANIFAVGDDIVITITSASSLKDMSFSIEW